ncbi:hypothetical protein TNCV_1939041 [Trichonephila clavipes]|nr:hypothetical protein TNCV_1939041 [Trichonephila clavipes]
MENNICNSMILTSRRRHFYLVGQSKHKVGACGVNNQSSAVLAGNELPFVAFRKKQDMLQLAEELGINATLNMTVPSIKIAITNSEGYEEEFVKNLYETIIANGKR